MFQYSNALANSNPQMADSGSSTKNNAANVAQQQRLIGRGIAAQDYNTETPQQQALFANQ